MIIENIGTAKTEANTKWIADMDKAQTRFMEVADKRKAEEMKVRTN